MTYEQILARSPKSTSAGDQREAERYSLFLATIVADTGLFASFTDSNRNYLYKLRAIWSRRADGLDEAWNLSGSTPGRRPKVNAKRRRIVQERYEVNEVEYDDVSRRMLLKVREMTQHQNENDEPS